VQMFGTKRNLFLAVVDSAFDKILAAFEAAEPSLIALGEAYRRLLRRDPDVGLVMLQGYAAAADPVVRDAVRRRYLRFTDASPGSPEPTPGSSGRSSPRASSSRCPRCWTCLSVASTWRGALGSSIARSRTTS